jgi:hypothetical protein
LQVKKEIYNKVDAKKVNQQKSSQEAPNWVTKHQEKTFNKTCQEDFIAFKSKNEGVNFKSCTRHSNNFNNFIQNEITIDNLIWSVAFQMFVGFVKKNYNWFLILTKLYGQIHIHPLGR